MNTTSIGILVQGAISKWTEKIIMEYSENFPNAELVLSTWSHEDTENILCKVVKTEIPKVSTPFKGNANYQKIGALAGLRIMTSNIIMKCRTDQFIRNKDIFKLYAENCPKNKIMIPNYTTMESIDYLASDFCQISSKKKLLEFWDSIPNFDGSMAITHPEIYLYMHFVLDVKRDPRPWPICLKEYFYVRDYHKDFQIEWEKLAKKNSPYREWFENFYPRCVQVHS